MPDTHQIEIGAPVAEVWRALTDPELTSRWYYELRVEGDWRPGGTVAYRFADGREGERGTILEVEPQRLLLLETRFLFDSEVSSLPAHRTRWELSPSGVGTAVTLTFDVADEARSPLLWLLDEAGFALKGLRLAVDPAARAGLARREEVGEVEIRDLTSDLAREYERFFDEIGFQDHPQWQGCYCGETNLRPRPGRTVAETRAEMVELVRAGGVTALLAFAGGEPVAWCNYGETTRLDGVMAKLKLERADHARVGSVACFVIAPQYRRHGLARRLLEAACDRLRDRGCTAVEAYPPAESESDYANYRGPLPMYREAGFEPYREAGRTLIVRRRL